ncbi:MAG: heme o synthase [Acidobacteriota bacterium]|nr:heme o synthase [Acidobacteriota bacterium]
MRTSAAVAGVEAVPSEWSDYFELTKPRITIMVLVTTVFGFVLGNQSEFSASLLVWTVVGTGLLSAGGSALNHFWERRSDALMERTASRPLPAGRMDWRRALAFGVTLALAGVGVLALTVNLLTAALGLAALVSYVLVYTPLKKVTSLATLIGAVPGALPPVMGWTAAQNSLSAGAWVLFGILFFWQLPHFLAIAWLCRGDYARAGFPMLPVVEPDGRSTARQAVLYGAALLPVSLAPSLIDLAGTSYFIGAALLGALFLGSCVAFWRSTDNRSARRVLLTSVLYLPAVLAVMAFDRFVH